MSSKVSSEISGPCFLSRQIRRRPLNPCLNDTEIFLKMKVYQNLLEIRQAQKKDWQELKNRQEKEG
jgi:hypothetical protein